MEKKIYLYPGQYLFRSAVRRRGSILVVSLWILFLLGAFALVINSYVQPQLQLSLRLKERIQAYFLAKAAVKKAISLVSSDETPKYDSLKEAWNNDEKIFKEISLGQGEFSLTKADSAEGQLIYGLTDEERKVNINKASLEMLRRFFELAAGLTFEQAGEIADSVIDWRDADNQVNLNGAEESFYSALTPAYHCKNSDFEVLEELLLVKSVTPEVYAKVKDKLTVYGQGIVNINTAGQEVLESLGFNQIIVSKIMHFRQGDDGKEQTADDNVFESVETITNSLTQKEDLSPEEISQLNNILSLGYIGVSSYNFKARAVGKTQSIYGTAEIVFVFSRDNTLKYWKEKN